MPILASTTYVNGYGKSSLVRAEIQQSMQGSADAFIVKYDTSGKAVWSARVASTGNDIGFGITTDSSGNVYVTGQGGNAVVTPFSSNGVAFGTTLANLGNGDIFIVKYNISGIVQWVARIASTAAESGRSITTDSSGNVYVTGQGGNAVVTAFSSNGVAFGTTLPNAGNGDTFIVKYDTSGIVQWVTRVAAVGDDIGYAIATDSSGNVYVTGVSGSAATTVTAFNSNGVSGATFSNSSADAFIVKYDTSGIVQWLARVASIQSDVGYGIATDSSGNVYIAGQGGNDTVSAFSSNGVAFGTTIANAGLGDAFIVKYDTSGIVQWIARIGSAGPDFAFAIATDSGGNVYVTGQGGATTVTAFSSNGVAFGTILPHAGLGDAFIVKYDTSGIVQWVARVASTQTDIGYAIATDSGGNVYVTGQGGNTTVTAFSSNGVAFGTTLPSLGAGDAFIVKYDTSGIVQWVTRVGVASARGMRIGSDGNLYISGTFAGNSTYIYGQSLSLFSTIPNSGGTDTYIVKYNTNGAPQWVARIASTAADIGYGIATDSGGNVYVAGQGGSAAVVTAFSSDGVAFGTTLANSGGTDTFIVKYNTSGIVQWVARIASPTADIGFGIATDSSGNVYITGSGGDGSGNPVTAFSSNGVAFGTTIANSGFTDAFIVKYDTSGIVQWVARVASTQPDIGYGITTDSSGNVYVTGQAGSGVVVTAFNSDGTSGGTIANSGLNDAFIVKYNTSGFVQWRARVASAGNDIGYGVATDSSGNVYFTGNYGLTTTATAFSSNGVAFGTTLPSSGSNDAFIVKYDTSGIVQWVARIASTGADIGYTIATDSSGNVYVAGQGGAGTVSAFSSNGVAFGITLPNLGNGDAFIVKYDTSGIVQWVTRVASNGVDTVFGIATDSSGNVYVQANTGDATFTFTVWNRTQEAFAVVQGSGCLCKYTSDGFCQWVRMIRGSSVSTNNRAVAVDGTSNVYITGATPSGATTQIYNSDDTIYSLLNTTGGSDCYVVKYSSNTTPQWVARVASTAADIGYGITTDSSGNVYVTGQGGSGVIVTAFSSNGVAFGTTLPNSGSNDAFIVKYNTSGIVQWVARVASTGDDIGFAIATDTSGNVYVTGQGGSGVVVTAFNADGSAFSPTLPNRGSSDAFIVKYNTSGVVQWIARVASTNFDVGLGIGIDSSGNVYITGLYSTSAAIAYDSSGNAFSPSLPYGGSSNDSFIVKYNPSGNVQWNARLSSTADDRSFAIATDSSGNVYVTGFYLRLVSDFIAYSSDGVAFGTTLPNSGSNDAFIVKYDTNGIVQWLTRIASTGSEIGYAIATDSGGNVYVTGQGGAALVTAFSSNGVAFGTTLANSGSNDTVIVKYDTNGFVQWITRVGSDGADIGYGIVTDSFGNVYVTGQGGTTVRAFNSDGTQFGSAAIYSTGESFLVKYDTNGTVQWLSIIANGTPISRAISLDSSNNIYTTGSFSGSALIPFNS